MRFTPFVFAVLIGNCVADQASFQTGIAHVLEQLDTLGFNSNTKASGLAAGYKLYAEHVLRSLSEIDPAYSTPSVMQGLTNVSNLLGQVDGMLRTEATTQQGLYQIAWDDFKNCENSVLESAESGARGTTGTKRTSHSDCRTKDEALREHNQANLADSSCFNFKNEIIAQPHDSQNAANGYMACTNTGHKHVFDFISDGAVYDDWEARIQKMATDVGSWKGNVDSDADACKTDFNLWITENTGSNYPDFGSGYSYDAVSSQTDGWVGDGANADVGCNHHQKEFEEAYCTWRIHLNAYCDHLDTCYGAEQTDFYQEEFTTFTMANQRIRDIAVVRFVKCIIDDLIATPNRSQSDWEADCKKNIDGTFDFSGTYVVDTVDGYNNTQLFLPVRDPCDKTDADPSPTPSTYASFFTEEYSAMRNNFNIFLHSAFIDTNSVCN